MAASVQRAPSAADALRDVAQMTVVDLRAKLTALHESARGKKAELAARLTERLDEADVAGPLRQQHLASNDDDEDADFMTDGDERVAGPQPTVHRTADFLAAMQPVSEWAAEQKDDDCPVVPAGRRQQLLQLVHTALGHNVHGMHTELRRAFYWAGMRADAAE